MNGKDIKSINIAEISTEAVKFFKPRDKECIKIILDFEEYIFDIRRTKTRQCKWGVTKTPKMEARTKLLRKLKEVFRCHRSQPIDRVIYLINPILRGWVNYYRIGNSSRCFGCVKDWVEKKARRHLMRARCHQGFGWERWSRQWINQTVGLYSDYKVRYYQTPKVSSIR